MNRESLKQQRQVSDEDAADEASWEAGRDDGFFPFFNGKLMEPNRIPVNH